MAICRRSVHGFERIAPEWVVQGIELQAKKSLPYRGAARCSTWGSQIAASKSLPMSLLFY